MYYLSDKSSDVKFEEISRCKSDIKRFLDRKHRMEENNEQPIIDNSEFVSEYHEENKECHEDLVKEEEHAIEEHEKMEIEEFHHDEQEHFAEDLVFKDKDHLQIANEDDRLHDNSHEINFSPFMKIDHDNEFKASRENDDFDLHAQDFDGRKFSDLNF